MGRVATILFAHRLGTSLEPECKMYRLAADVFNDTAMVFDCFSPALPKAPRVILLGLSSVLRALCGVAAGSSKASLSAHFAKWGNLGELNAVSPPLYFLGAQLDIAWKEHQPMCPYNSSPVKPSPRLTELLLAHSSRMSTKGQTERLEPGNCNLAIGVRLFENTSDQRLSLEPNC